MAAYYNEIDEYAAQWLRNLITAGLIAPGDVDTRSIIDVRPDDLRGYTQCHFFAGLGGWSGALRIARWPDDEAVWTGSCPCQPFSSAGKRKGFADDRHLWPVWRELIQECNPAIVFGEQVARATVWLDAVFADLEGQGYACGAAVLPAAGVNAPHRRDRIWFVAWGGRANRPDSDVAFLDGEHRDVADAESERRQPRSGLGQPMGAGSKPTLEFEGRAALPAKSGGRTDNWAFEPAVGRVAHGVPARVAKLRALGNAIVPQVAAEFIIAAREATLVSGLKP